MKAVGIPPTARFAWSRILPPLVALGLILVGWQVATMSGCCNPAVLPTPARVGSRLLRDLHTTAFYAALGTTLVRAAVGFAVAIVLGLGIGLLVAAFDSLRAAARSILSALQTIPSIAWFPFALLLFSPSEGAIMFVVVMGAAPSIANGLIGGIDHVPPLYVRAGRVLGASGWSLYRRVMLPASMPAVLAGLKQAWAFAWRSLLAGELLVVVGSRPSLGVRLQAARRGVDGPAELFVLLLVILAIGVAMDRVFSLADSRLRRNRGLLQESS